MNSERTGGVILGAWIAFVVVAYVLAMLFIVPPTIDARMAVTVIFVLCGAQVTGLGVILWVKR